jgi:hypothetical protein
MRAGQFITLRPLQDTDADFTRTLRNRYRHNFFDEREISESEHREYIARIREHPWIRFWIIEKNGRPLGTISLNTNPKICEMGNFICPDYSLAAIEAEYLVIQAAFTDYKLSYVVCNSLANNAVVNVHTWCGFEIVNQHETNGRLAVLQRVDPTTFREADIAGLLDRISSGRS